MNVEMLNEIRQLVEHIRQCPCTKFCQMCILTIDSIDRKAAALTKAVTRHSTKVH